MQTDKPKQLFLTLAFLVILFTEGVTLLAIQIIHGDRPTVFDFFIQPPSQQNLRAFETQLQDESWFVFRLRPFMQSMRFMILNDLGKKVIQGIDGWLFYHLDVQYLTEKFPHGLTSKQPDESTDAVIQSILSFRNRLSKRGIHLLVVPAPGKPGIYPDKLTDRVSDPAVPVNGNSLRLLSRLQQEGVEVVNLFDNFSMHRRAEFYTSTNPLYLVQDTHWSPEGMKLAARLVAKRLLENGWVHKGETDYLLKPVTFSRLGDVLRMTQIPHIENRFIPETIHATQVIDTSTHQPYADDLSSDVLVMGDSFLRIYERDEPGSGGFVAHLASELGKPLSSIINDGGASTLVHQELYRKPNLLVGKKVVIWEFVERDIRFGTEGWQDVPLPPG